MIYWTAKNNSSFLNGRRSANTMRSAVIAAHKYVNGELYGEGVIFYFDSEDDDDPIRIDEKSIHTSFKWVKRNPNE